jgi:hypothetical protein
MTSGLLAGKLSSLSFFGVELNLLGIARKTPLFVFGKGRRWPYIVRFVDMKVR